MTIIEMLGVWAERTNTIASDGAARLNFPEESLCLAGSSEGTWGTTFDDWEEDHFDDIKAAIDVLMYGADKDKGILTLSEVYAVEAHHLKDVPDVFVSNRGGSLATDYSKALFKLKPAMVKRNFLVD